MNAFHSLNVGFAFYSVVQMLLLSGCVAAGIYWIYRHCSKKWVSMIAWAYYCAFPAHPVLAISATKDVLFSGLFLLAVIFFLDMPKHENKIGRSEQLYGIGLLAVLMFFRNNAVYALVFTLMGLLFLKKKKSDVNQKTLKYLGVFILCSILIYMLISDALIRALKAESGSKREMLSVPLQQVARTYLIHEEEIAGEDKRAILEMIGGEYIGRYTPQLSDLIKDEMNEHVLFDNLSDYISLYIRLGVNFPKTYASAFLHNMMGYWFIGDVSHSRIYGDKLERANSYLVTGMKYIEGIPVPEHTSLLPGPERIYEQITTYCIHQKYPAISWLFAPAFYIWIIIFAGGTLIIKKRVETYPLLLFLGGYFITLLLKPCCLMRYVYPYVLCAPVLTAECFRK